MNIVAIDCATSVLSVAVARDAQVYEAAIDAGNSHSERLLDVVDALLRFAGLAAREADVFVCSRGPGSWTGLRIAFAAVKGFAAALEKPYVSIPTLDCLALSAPANFAGVTLPALDAKQHRFFAALYTEGERQSDYLDATPETLAGLLAPERPVWLTGEGALMLAAQLSPLAPGRSILVDADYRRPIAPLLLRYIARHNDCLNTSDPHDAAPLYLRKSDAEINLDAARANALPI